MANPAAAIKIPLLMNKFNIFLVPGKHDAFMDTQKATFVQFHSGLDLGLVWAGMAVLSKDFSVFYSVVSTAQTWNLSQASQACMYKVFGLG